MKLSEVLDRQAYLFKHNCKKCEYRMGYKDAVECGSCPVQEEFLEIGKIISQITLNKRKRR